MALALKRLRSRKRVGEGSIIYYTAEKRTLWIWTEIISAWTYQHEDMPEGFEVFNAGREGSDVGLTWRWSVSGDFGNALGGECEEDSARGKVVDY